MSSRKFESGYSKINMRRIDALIVSQKL